MLAALLTAVLSMGPANVPWGVHGFFCQSDSAGMSQAGSDECWRLGPGTETSPYQRGWLNMIKWADLEPRNGEFDFSAFDRNLSVAAGQKGYEMIVFVEIVKGGNATTPQWLYDAGVPVVRYKSGGMGNGNGYAPFYLNPTFQFYYARMLRAFAAHLRALPAALRARVLAVQAAFGITGDDRPWNGVPVEAQYRISDAQWANYTRTFALDVFCAEYHNTSIGLLVNLDNPGVNQSDSSWFLHRCASMRGVKMEKDGIVSHGYQLNGEQQLYDKLAAPLLWQRQPWGDYGRSRGELALEPTPVDGQYGNWAESPWWSLHANAGWALTYGLDVWNLYALFIANATFAPTMQLFNRYAGAKDPATAPGALLLLRDGLDGADFQRFPAAEYGDDSRAVQCVNGSAAAAFPGGGCTCSGSEGPVCCRNVSRLEAIAAAHAARGARMDAPSAATGKSVKQKKAAGLNDVGCQIWPGNYGVHMQQKKAAQTSVGYWRVGAKVNSPYGRFARGSDNSNGKSTMYFALDQRLFGGLPFNATTQRSVQLRVVYYDGAAGGAWRAKYDAQSEVSKALPLVSTAGSGSWKEALYLLPDARFGGGQSAHADFSLHLNECGGATEAKLIMHTTKAAETSCADIIIAEVEVRKPLA
eukprot:g2452.t1